MLLLNGRLCGALYSAKMVSTGHSSGIKSIYAYYRRDVPSQNTEYAGMGNRLVYYPLTRLKTLEGSESSLRKGGNDMARLRPNDTRSIMTFCLTGSNYTWNTDGNTLYSDQWEGRISMQQWQMALHSPKQYYNIAEDTCRGLWRTYRSISLLRRDLNDVGTFHRLQSLPVVVASTTTINDRTKTTFLLSCLHDTRDRWNFARSLVDWCGPNTTLRVKSEVILFRMIYFCLQNSVHKSYHGLEIGIAQSLCLYLDQSVDQSTTRSKAADLEIIFRAHQEEEERHTHLV